MLLRDLSFRYKIPLRGSLLVLVTALAVTGSLIFLEYDELRRDLVARSASMGRLLARTLVTPMAHDDVWRAFEIINSPFHTSGEDAMRQSAEIVMVLDARQRVYVSTHPAEYPMLTDPNRSNPDFGMLQQAMATYREFETKPVEVPESRRIYVLTPIVADGVLLGTLVMGYSSSAFVERFVGIAKRAAMVTLLVIAVLLPASWYWARRFAAPLVALAHSMSRVGASIPEDADVRIDESRDEVGQLGAAFRSMLRELREKEALEREMVLSERLAAVGRLSAAIAHEVNNPLGGMLNALSTFKRHGDGDPQAVKTASLLERGLLQIKETVAALLVEARAESHSVTRQDIEDTHTLVAADAARKSLRFDWENDVVGTLPLPSTLVRQVLINLMLNAIQAADPEGWISAHVYRDSRSLAVVVANDGAYIPPEEMGYLFEPFARRRERGHGLGLWVTYQIVSQLGGEISAASEPGRTRFSLTLPLPEEQT